MINLCASQMRDLDGKGLWDGFVCGASVAFLVGMTVSPDPVSKLAWGTTWTTAIGSCGSAFF
jgi:hypothetical protein